LGSISSLFADKHISVRIESKVSDSAYEKLGEYIFELSALLASNQKDRLSVGKKKTSFYTMMRDAFGVKSCVFAIGARICPAASESVGLFRIVTV